MKKYLACLVVCLALGCRKYEPVFVKQEPKLHPDLVKDWTIQYNVETKKWRVIDNRFNLSWFGEYDSRAAIVKKLNREHEENLAKARAINGWKDVE
jgi:hypothetical protein